MRDLSRELFMLLFTGSTGLGGGGGGAAPGLGGGGLNPTGVWAPDLLASCCALPLLLIGREVVREAVREVL